MCMCVHVCVRVRVCDSHRDHWGGVPRALRRGVERSSPCVCVCVCVHVCVRVCDSHRDHWGGVPRALRPEVERSGGISEQDRSEYKPSDP